MKKVSLINNIINPIWEQIQVLTKEGIFPTMRRIADKKGGSYYYSYKNFVLLYEDIEKEYPQSKTKRFIFKAGYNNKSYIIGQWYSYLDWEWNLEDLPLKVVDNLLQVFFNIYEDIIKKGGK